MMLALDPFILNAVCKDIDASNSLTALLSAREGDGKDAANKLYGDKFGFVDYSQKHQVDIWFRYIRFNQELANRLVVNSMFKQQQVLATESVQLKPQV